jgi:hypothetical protein
MVRRFYKIAIPVTSICFSNLPAAVAWRGNIQRLVMTIQAANLGRESRIVHMALSAIGPYIVSDASAIVFVIGRLRMAGLTDAGERCLREGKMLRVELKDRGAQGLGNVTGDTVFATTTDEAQIILRFGGVGIGGRHGAVYAVARTAINNFRSVIDIMGAHLEHSGR